MGAGKDAMQSTSPVTQQVLVGHAHYVLAKVNQHLEHDFTLPSHVLSVLKSGQLNTWCELENLVSTTPDGFSKLRDKS